ncbi:universal stress protein [Nocardia sp. BMG111209]|uniref:universal stress protein n=1 Tax=Nocardia sp. BMG111209 TaxID=1160137 RepID=UPI0003665C6D|nr:universal stress protein [Nocardia sp. BMG111209]
MNRYRTIVVDADGSETSRIAVHAAATIAGAAGARLILVCAYGRVRAADVAAAADVLKGEAHLVRRAAPAEDTLTSAVREALGWGATEVVGRAVPGSRVDALLSAVAEDRADLVVVSGDGARTPVGRLLGTLSDEISRRSRATVLSVSPMSARTVSPPGGAARRKALGAGRVRSFIRLHGPVEVSSRAAL